MRIAFILLLLPKIASAQWTNWPAPKGSAATKEACEEVFGPPCYQLPSSDEDAAEIVDLVDDVLVVDDDKVKIRETQKELEAIAEEAERLKLEQLKTVVESKDPSAEELREALKILISKELAVFGATDSFQEKREKQE